MIDEKKYRDWIMNPKDRNAKPWLLMVTYTPNGVNLAHF